jgi:hypothetical protein
MKKYSSLLILFLFPFMYQLNAQTEKGTMLLGGNAAFISQNGESIFSLNPRIGLFAAENLAIGLNATFITGSGSTIYDVGPFVRSYFGSSSHGKFFAQGTVGYSGFSTDFGSDSDFSWGLGAGYAFFLNPNIALEIGPQYSKTGSRDGIFSFVVGFQIHFKK